jgi:hypothetical protein
MFKALLSNNGRTLFLDFKLTLNKSMELKFVDLESAVSFWSLQPEAPSTRAQCHKTVYVII